VLDRALWEDHKNPDSSHDFGKDIIPRLLQQGRRIIAYPYSGYWVDVGTLQSYWQAHMDLLADPPSVNLNDRSWVIHTRTEERPPVMVARGATVENAMLSDGAVIEPGARVIDSVLSPGVVVRSGAEVIESVLLTDTVVEAEARLERVLTDKRVQIGAKARLGGKSEPLQLTVVGKNSEVPPAAVVEPGATIGTDLLASDYPALLVKSGEILETKRQPYEI
jgi:glucose-1-phosphate adenylyltransferase